MVNAGRSSSPTLRLPHASVFTGALFYVAGAFRHRYGMDPWVCASAALQLRPRMTKVVAFDANHQRLDWRPAPQLRHPSAGRPKAVA